jgi:dihydroorotate dehydrogenase
MMIEFLDAQSFSCLTADDENEISGFGFEQYSCCERLESCFSRMNGSSLVNACPGHISGLIFHGLTVLMSHGLRHMTSLALVITLTESFDKMNPFLLGRLATSLLRVLPAELAHECGLSVLKSPLGNWLGRLVDIPTDQALQLDVRGIGALDHPIGLAAGFDKNASALASLSGLGFSFIEVGAVTPRSQPGNPRPRLFRNVAEQSLVNRMGFNNDGADVVGRRIVEFTSERSGCPIGVNLGKNKDTPADRALDDYLSSYVATKERASFFVVNVSSPNTPGLRELASPGFIKTLAGAFGSDLPRVWVKFDPDMEKDRFQQLIETVAASGYAGVVLTNTHRVESPQPGGLSGRPLFPLANRALQWSWEVHRGGLVTIGVGGVMDGEDAFQKIALGADVVQIYTALAYDGPLVVSNILRGLRGKLQSLGLKSISDARGLAYAGQSDLF